ncbi:PrsW family intramembrane metalloprotease [Corynebacterium ulcerans]|uniref:PrsW family intramembrane metalloprotease n=2 Tax=Corynebacterium ulcerans TaxID=65058 RepID=UPI001F52B628|nr:PrsW family intramembrane metalloprotease [Corynebacterium ulcerans]
MKDREVLEMKSRRRTSALWWLLVVASPLSLAYLLKTLGRELRAMPLPSLYIFLICIAGGILVVGVLVLVDRSRLRKEKYNRIMWGSAFVFGGLIGPVVAVKTNGEIDRFFPLIFGREFYREWGVAVFGPLSEEWIKLVIVLAIILLYRKWIVRPTHGFFVGAFVGLGFQLTEDFWFAVGAAFEDINSDLSGGVTLATFRVLLGVVSHWTYTGVAAIGLCYLLGIGFSQGETGRARFFIAVGFLVLSLGLHGLWNSPLTFGLDATVAVLVKLVISISIFIVVARWLCRNEKAAVSTA